MAINTYFQNIANAIRTKTGSAGLITPAEMPDEILNITTGTSGIDTTKIRYLAFVINSIRSNSDNYIQLAEINFLDTNDEPIVFDTNNCTYNAINGVGYTGGNLAPSKMWTVGSHINAAGRTIMTKNNNNIYYYVFECFLNYDLDLSDAKKWCWYTADDTPNRDPVTYSIVMGNNINNIIQKYIIDSVSYTIPTTNRDALAYTGLINL